MHKHGETGEHTEDTKGLSKPRHPTKGAATMDDNNGSPALGIIIGFFMAALFWFCILGVFVF